MKFFTRRHLSKGLSACRFMLPLLLYLYAVKGLAQEKDICSPGQLGCVPVGEWEIKLGIGVGVRDNPLINSEDIPLFLLPDVSYYGERFFIDTYVGGFTFAESHSTLLSAIVTVSFDQIYFQTSNFLNFTLESGPFAYEVSNPSGDVDSDASNVVAENDVRADGNAVDPDSKQVIPADKIIILDRLHSRGTAMLTGFELAYFPGRWDISVQLLQDFFEVHEGKEARVAISRFITFGQEHFEIASGFTWQDDRVVDYYWGIDESEVKNPALAYHPNSSTSPFVRIDWRRELFGNWSIQATLHNKWLSKEISESPLVEEDKVLTVFLGGVYHF